MRACQRVRRNPARRRDTGPCRRSHTTGVSACRQHEDRIANFTVDTYWLMAGSRRSLLDGSRPQLASTGSTLASLGSDLRKFRKRRRVDRRTGSESGRCPAEHSGSIRLPAQRVFTRLGQGSRPLAQLRPPARTLPANSSTRAPPAGDIADRALRQRRCSNSGWSGPNSRRRCAYAPCSPDAPRGALVLVAEREQDGRPALLRSQMQASISFPL
jgi:hypothetical protein